MNAINPDLYSNLTVLITQPFLAGFGVSHQRALHPHCQEQPQITDLAFQQLRSLRPSPKIENIYWDLVNAYQDEQIKERSLAFAQQTSPTIRSSSNSTPFRQCR